MRPGYRAQKTPLLHRSWGLLWSAPGPSLLVGSMSSHVQLGTPCLKAPGRFHGNTRGDVMLHVWFKRRAYTWLLDSWAGSCTLHISAVLFRFSKPFHI